MILHQGWITKPDGARVVQAVVVKEEPHGWQVLVGEYADGQTIQNVRQWRTNNTYGNLIDAIRCGVVDAVKREGGQVETIEQALARIEATIKGLKCLPS